MNTNVRASNIPSSVEKTYFIVRGKTLTKEEAIQQNFTDEYINDLRKKPEGEKTEEEKKLNPWKLVSGEIIQKQNGFYYDYDKQLWIFEYPLEFLVPSDHNKFLVFQYCRCSVNDSVHAECEVHASFIPRDQYCDSLVYYANLQPPDDNRKYKVNTNTNQRFAVWFTNGKGEKWEKDTPINFVMFLKLQY